MGRSLHHQRLPEPEAMGAIVERIHLEPQCGLKVKQGFGLAVDMPGKYRVKKRPRLRHCTHQMT